MLTKKLAQRLQIVISLKKKPPLRPSAAGEGAVTWQRLRLQRETENQVCLLCTGISHNLTKDWNRERIRNLDIFRCLQ